MALEAARVLAAVWHPNSLAVVAAGWTDDPARRSYLTTSGSPAASYRGVTGSVYLRIAIISGSYERELLTATAE